MPAGFSYRSFHDTEYPAQSTLDEGGQIPGRHDGIAAFDGPGDDVTLVRNHEVAEPAAAFKTTSSTYDAQGTGWHHHGDRQQAGCPVTRSPA